MGQQGFARATLPHQGQGTAGSQGQVQRLQQGLLAIANLHALDVNSSHDLAPCEERGWGSAFWLSSTSASSIKPITMMGASSKRGAS